MTLFTFALSQVCHPERSAAQSKDLRFFPSASSRNTKDAA
jgi:hypothetical protein